MDGITTQQTALSQKTTMDQLLQVAEMFLSEQSIMESSRGTYRYGLKAYFKWILSKGKELPTMTPADIVAFKEYLEGTKLSSLTVISYLQAVKSFYWWVESRQLGENIAKRVRIKRAEGKEFLKMHLREQECRELLETVYNSGKKNSFRDYCIINLILHTGLRTMEVCRLDVGDIEYRMGRRIMKVWGKGHRGKDKLVVLTDEAFAPISEYLASRGRTRPDDPLFVTNGKGTRGDGCRMGPRSIQMICKENLRAIGLEGHEYSAHSLRHTTAVLILKNGGDIKDAQRVLRHSSSDTTEIYLRSIENEERLEKAAEPLLDGLFNIKTK